MLRPSGLKQRKREKFEGEWASQTDGTSICSYPPEDLVIEKEGAVVLVDSVSLDFLRGTRIDFVDDLIGQSFKIDNPNVKASCGCGASFTV